jgi:FAD/FMN-containing dehydrogenase
MLGTNAPVGSVGKGEMITMAGATEFSPLGALDIAGLQDGFRGELLSPQDPGYEDARRVWNGSIDRFPALIARCAGVADLIAAVMFAKDNGLLVAVRGGGHSYPGLSVCDGGLVIDLSLMKGIRVDPEARTVRAQAGVLLGELDRETQAFGLAVPSGIVTHTGLSGLTLGGGINWLMRKYGLAIDQLLSVDLITAEGEFVKASASENPDLFWGLRGEAATSVSSPSSSSGSTRWGLSCSRGRSSGPLKTHRTSYPSTASGSKRHRTNS